jgi:hypothetical protein
MYGRVVNKTARHNLCFDDFDRECDYDNGKGTIVSFDKVEKTNIIRNNLKYFVGEKGDNLKAEGNYYYDISKTFIGYHGDTERRIVIAMRLGMEFNLKYNWFYNNKAIGNNMSFMLNSGDLYIMSEKATGQDWKKSSIYTLRHAAGDDKYINKISKNRGNKLVKNNVKSKKRKINNIRKLFKK